LAPNNCTCLIKLPLLFIFTFWPLATKTSRTDLGTLVDARALQPVRVLYGIPGNPYGSRTHFPGCTRTVPIRRHGLLRTGPGDVSGAPSKKGSVQRTCRGGRLRVAAWRCSRLLPLAVPVLSSPVLGLGSGLGLGLGVGSGHWSLGRTVEWALAAARWGGLWRVESRKSELRTPKSVVGTPPPRKCKSAYRIGNQDSGRPKLEWGRRHKTGISYSKLGQKL
jgi:hypothetical protein